MKNKPLKIFLLSLFGLIILIQFIPVEKTNPPVKSEPVWDSPQTKEFAKRACYDCHSNETNWPWYSHIAPFSWQVAAHVNEGRKHFNISEYPSKDDDEAAEEVQAGKMPLKGYLLLHSEARLSEEENKLFIKGLRATFNKKNIYDDEHHEKEHHGSRINDEVKAYIEQY